jgi:Fic family protein
MERRDFAESAPGRLVRTEGNRLAFIPDPLPGRFDWSTSVVTTLGRAERSLGQLAGLGRRVPSPQRLLRTFLRREAELSSRIEGTRAKVQTMVLFAHLPEIAADVPDVQEVENNFEALVAGLAATESRPVSLGIIRELHKILLRDVRGHDKTPGEFRRVQAFIGRTDRMEDARFVPAPPHEIEPSMRALESYVRGSDGLPPLARVAMVHYQFEAIHPFADGNGRIGRVLIMLMLRSEGLLPWPLINPSAPLEQDRRTYYDHLLSVSQRGSWPNWIEFFAGCIAREANNAITRIEALESLRESYRRRVQQARSSALLPRVIDHLFAEPAITVNAVADVLSVGYSSAKKLVERLVREKIVREVTGRVRDRVFLAQGVIDLLSADEPSGSPADDAERPVSRTPSRRRRK